MTVKNNFLLILIVACSFFLRVVAVEKFPPSLNWDEISHGYNAYSVLKTGSDEWGKILPITNFRAYGDYPLPLNLYLTVPFIAVFGLTEFAIRFPHVLLGSGTVLSVYFLALGLTKDKKKSLLVSLLVAITPWYFFTSRFVLQSNLSVFLLVTGLASFFNRDKNKYLLNLSFLCLGLTLFSYHTTRIFTPLLVAALLIIYRRKILTKASIFLLTIFFLPLPLILANPEARARSNVVFLLSSASISKIESLRNQSSFTPLVSKLVYNRPVYFVKEFSKNYIEYFSPQFLFLKGGTQYQFSLPNTGLLYIVNLPFFYLGIYFVLRKVFKGEKNYFVLLIWFLLAPIPASITSEHFAVLRATTLLPLPEIFVVVGIFEVGSWLKKKKFNLILFASVFALMLGISVENYVMKYFTDYSKNYSWSWQYGYKEAVLFAKENYQNYDKIIFTKKYGEPHEYVLFYNQWDPKKYKNDENLIRFTKSDWWWVDRFDKYYFVNDWQIKDLKLESGGLIKCDNKCLLVTSPNNYPGGWKKLKTIEFLNGQIAFEIYEN